MARRIAYPPVCSGRNGLDEDVFQLAGERECEQILDHSKRSWGAVERDEHTAQLKLFSAEMSGSRRDEDDGSRGFAHQLVGYASVNRATRRSGGPRRHHHEGCVVRFDVA